MSGAVDIAVIGAGLVGASLAWGFVRAGATVALIDAGEDRFHASAGNFGLVWVQGKGASCPEYADLSLRSARAWRGFAEALDDGGVGRDGGVGGDAPLGYRASGGVKLALGTDELRQMVEGLERMHNRSGPAGNDTVLLDADEIRARVPAVGPEVTGGTFCPHDGHADPLSTLNALHRAVRRAGGRVVRAKALEVVPQAREQKNLPQARKTAEWPQARVTEAPSEPGRAHGAAEEFASGASPAAGGFVVETEAGRVACGRVVLAAGLGSAALAGPLGLRAELRPQRGQIVVTERTAPFMDPVSHTVRQTGDGTVMLGDSKEEVGFDTGTTAAVTQAILTRSVRCFPHLARLRMVRTWGALRVMSPDGLPIYQTSERFPGASLVTCHSGVTLASSHAGEVADAILGDRLNAAYPLFSPHRFEAAA